MCWVDGVDDAVIGCCVVKGIAKRALTANKWSRRCNKLDTCSSSLKFSARSWCRQDNNDATVFNHRDKLLEFIHRIYTNVIQTYWHVYIIIDIIAKQRKVKWKK